MLFYSTVHWFSLPSLLVTYISSATGYSGVTCDTKEVWIELYSITISHEFAHFTGQLRNLSVARALRNVYSILNVHGMYSILQKLDYQVVR